MIAFQNLTSLQLLSLFWKLSLVFSLEYLTQNFIKSNLFWNPHDKQISKLSLVTQFDKDLKEKAGVTKFPFSYDSYCKFTGFLMGK